MKVAFGWKAHSGWAALVAVGEDDGDLVVTERRRIELVEDAWAKQPYHAAEGQQPKTARDLVTRGIAQTTRVATRELRAAIKREQTRGNRVVASAVLTGSPMPDWTTDQILAVHFRMHKAEGVLFRAVLAQATHACGLKLVAIPERELGAYAEKTLRKPGQALNEKIAQMGKAAGPPWGKDQKDAAVAALIALQPRLK
ncbi:MAG TPA: hypothetical protein VLL54_10795 [Pyrinomonadaceae bacterium]|nr:hypothetical protein [Pyrinomonadaceae bacterium]